jgi:pilus assembly protein CpaB
MRRLRPFLLIGIALVAALGSSTLVYRYLTVKASQTRVAPAFEATVTRAEVTMIAVADIDLQWGTPVTEEMVVLAPYPNDYLPEGHFTSVEEVIGRVTFKELRRNEPVLEFKLNPADQTTGGVAAVMEADMRAMAIRVDDEIGVAGFVKPGDRVDVLVSIKGGQGNDGKESMAKLVLEYRRVLAIGTEMVRMGKEDEPRPVRVLTLEVSPEEAEKLALATSQGKLRLVLRHPLNDSKTLTAGATVESLLASNRIAARSKAKALGQSVQVIKGGTVSEVSF